MDGFPAVRCAAAALAALAAAACGAAPGPAEGSMTEPTTPAPAVRTAGSAAALETATFALG
jgi:hypothetical protein